MKNFQFRFTTSLVAALSVGLIVTAGVNFQQRRTYQLPGDGVTWADSPQGVVAWIVSHDQPGDRAGIREGDLLVSINRIPIRTWVDASRAVFASGVWSKATYELVRRGEEFQTTVVIQAEASAASLRYFLDVVGLLYLFIGTFILLRRWSARKSLHFYLFCLASFALYTLSYTGKLNHFDSMIYWLNVLAWVLQPALFLHFCLSFPEPPAALKERPYIYALLYVPGTVLLATHVLVSKGIFRLALPLLTARWVLDTRELIHLVLYFLAGAAVLLYRYRHAQTPLLKQQLKWVTRGTFLAIVPFAALYALPYALGFIPSGWMRLSALTLIFLPLTFGYAIVRYRLMDVDILFRRGIAYTLATAAVVAVSFGLIALFADFFRTTFPVLSRGGWVLAVIVAAFLFQPLVNWFQLRLERFFNPQHYDYRRTLLEFARELTSELHLDRLLELVSARLTETLRVERVVVFLMDGSNGLRCVKASGLHAGGDLDLSFLDPERSEMRKGYLFFDSLKPPFGLPPSAEAAIERLGLHYYLPFKVNERILGYLGLGKTRDGDFLSTEDVDLLKTISVYISIALENARLYESLEQEAFELQTLRDFSQNIVESIHVGVLACNLEQRIEAWNSAMEKLYGLARPQAVGKKLQEVFPPELLAELPQATESRRSLSLYKFQLLSFDARKLIVNLSTVPLIAEPDRVIGRLIILDDLTERVQLEDQLLQAEKLSSTGLLAAGIAHEVNTPLAVIASQAQMIAREIPTDDPRARTVERIIKQAFRASEIVNNLLKFSRVSGSEYSEIDLNRVIRETLSLIDPMLRTSRISVNSQLSNDLPAVYGNFGRLQQVFMNLIMNARDAMPRGGELTIATETENSTVHVEVTDSGVGIPPGHLNKIFDPFFTTKSSSRGTGLGLAVTYGIIREHSGKIRVESAPGRGTSFRLEFPLAKKAVNVGS